MDDHHLRSSDPSFGKRLEPFISRKEISEWMLVTPGSLLSTRSMKAFLACSSARLVRCHLPEFSERNKLSAVFIPQCQGDATQAFADCDASDIL